MKNYMMINGTKIEISQETADNLEKEFGEKVTYSVGDRFFSDNTCNEKVILVRTWRSSHSDKAAFVRLESGEPWNNSFTARDFKKIRPSEIGSKIGCLVRYWDARKNEKC